MRFKNATALSAACSYGMPRRWPPIVMIVLAPCSATESIQTRTHLQFSVHLRVDDAVLERHGTRPGEQWLDPMLTHGRPVGGIDEIEAVAAEPCRLAALVVERQLGIGPEIDAPQTLLDAALARDSRLRSGRRWAC